MNTGELIDYLEHRPDRPALKNGVSPSTHGEAAKLQRAATRRAMDRKALTWAEVLRDRFHQIMAANPEQLQTKLNQMNDVIDLWLEDLKWA